MNASDTESFTSRPEEPGDAPAIEALLDRAMGPGRHVLTTYRLREGVEPLAELGLVSERAGEMVGTVRFWPIVIGGFPALLLGPLAIDPAIRNKGCGLGLMQRGLELARKAGHKLVILVGDAPYYAKAGFEPVPPGHLTLPGPVNPARILYVELASGALDEAKGAVRR